MDPFTEKLLERTRARRENLQKKMADRPTAAGRPMAKRSREPLAENNSTLIAEPPVEKVLPSAKPSPSKRRCSDENALNVPAVETENKQPEIPRTRTPTTTTAAEPVIVDRKPPIAPSLSSSNNSTRPTLSSSSSSSLERPAPAPVATQPPTMAPQVLAPQPTPEPMVERTAVCPPEQAVRGGSVETKPQPAAPSVGEADAPVATSGMKARLQKLAAQRHNWDSAAPSDDVTMGSPIQRYDVPPDPVPAPSSSGTPLGRKGRFANLAATIGSWEDDLSHPSASVAPCRDNAQGARPKPGTGSSSGTRQPPPPYGSAPQTASSKTQAASKPTPAPAPAPAPSARQTPVCSPVKSSRVVLPSAQHTEIPEPRPTAQTTTRALPSPSPVSSPQKTPASRQPSGPAAPRGGIVHPASPQKTPLSQGSSSASQSPLKKIQGSRELEAGKGAVGAALASKTATAATATAAGALAPAAATPLQSQHRDATPAQPKATTGTPGVKSFLERFGERCQELNTNKNSPSVSKGTPTTPAATAAASSGTPKSLLIQERLNKIQGTTPTSTTADLTQKQKMEREMELAQIRSRFQKGNAVRNTKPEASFNRSDSKERDSSKESLAPSVGDVSTDTEMKSKAPTSPCVTSSPRKKMEGLAEKKTVEFKEVEKDGAERSHEERVKAVEEEEDKKDEEEVIEKEMNVDGSSINSAVINELFDGVLEESNEQSVGEEDDDEEDALNISSMSLLTETVAAAVKSPERKLLTSTPASSFLEKSSTPESSSSSRQSRFQRVRMLRAGSSDSLENPDEEQNLLYSIDAYRSTRVKAETERQHVKQVIVRKEDVSQRAEQQSRAASHVSIKQKMKELTNELNLQQTVIHQASQALNCCTDEEHGKGSQVEAEAERLLLIATERRVALKAELERVKAAGPGVDQRGGPGEGASATASKGSISLLELRLPLKADFVCSTANRPELSSHYFFVMIRAGPENSVATPLANTRSALSGDALTFATKFELPNVSNDFEIDIEVYYLVHKRELHSDKRKKPTKSKAITPKRFLAITKSNLQTPVVASPGGPNAVRTSNFSLVGSHKLTLASIGKNKFPLEKIKYEGLERELLSDMFQKKVPFLCPLEGHIYLKMQCEVGSRVEERGFLTMFEDVSGFGAWHRRWCVLSGYCISYWTYPDDERRKNPIGRINLANCTSHRVEPANREFCARPNTFELITVRPQREDDRETLVSQCHNTMCVTKNWLSADTKDERNLWMQKLNQILVDLRTWQPDSCYRPL
ncbi:anillin isoform X2 [Engraulis encrasicolus]|uniref:anillin isoform X2 n=1 Tax=Engraulis encrasicolus TaxID=184585 RepID=UPI002FD2DD32